MNPFLGVAAPRGKSESRHVQISCCWGSLSVREQSRTHGNHGREAEATGHVCVLDDCVRAVPRQPHPAYSAALGHTACELGHLRQLCPCFRGSSLNHLGRKRVGGAGKNDCVWTLL